MKSVTEFVSFFEWFITNLLLIGIGSCITLGFGLVKLKKLITATKINVTGEIDPKILPPLLIGKKFKATCELTKDEKYLEIRNINSIVEADFEEEDIFKDIKTEDPWSI